MGNRPDRKSMSATRRAVLGGAGAALLSGSAGCSQRMGSILDRSSKDRATVTIKTVPSDTDETSLAIAHHLSEHLEASGVEAQVVPMPRHKLLLDVLVNHEYDIYVAVHPGLDDPDGLRAFLHSEFAQEAGWQNPFGVTELGIDKALEHQRYESGRGRWEAATTAMEQIVRNQPFVTVARPDDVRAVREDRFDGWGRYGFDSPLTYLSLAPVDRQGNGSGAPTLTVASTDATLTRNLNPLAVEFRGRGAVTGLLYDPLVRLARDERLPWLASDVEWSSDGERATATVRLRADLSWHDGKSLTAGDVAFTYRFLQDTSLGNGDVPVPAPRFRGRSSMVADTTVQDDRQLTLTFEASEEVARRAMTVPILPAHVWRSKTSEAAIAGVEVAEGTTEALVWNNQQAVGSGPLRVDDQVTGEHLSLTRFDDHFLLGETDLAESFRPAYRTLNVRITPSSASAVALVAAARADATVTRVAPKDVPRIGRASNLRQVSDRSSTFYHVGFNARTAPLSNPRFRRVVARLIDKAYLVRTALSNYGEPAATPFDGTKMPTGGLEWRGNDPVVPFIGEDGELDERAARQRFEAAGYRYDEQGRLVLG